MEPGNVLRTLFETREHEKKLGLLDDIDELRTYGITSEIALPQLMVAGDQSSGKSSVLEAVSGVAFPTKDNLCTRFATEVILRRSTKVHMQVSIVPGQDRGVNEIAQLQRFSYPVTLDNMGEMFEKAKTAMGISEGSSSFCQDILRIEISGPAQPHLTIIDLPGLFHSGTKSQSKADKIMVKNMVRKYMSGTRTIILAVVTAKNDINNQTVLDLATEIDRGGHRTLGIITKPDTLSVGSESETAFVNLARNQDVELHLGWHVVMNKNYENRAASLAERNVKEKEFLDEGVWRDLPAEDKGIDQLREKLMTILFQHIRACLPGLIDDLQIRVKECQAILLKLGDVRLTDEDKKRFLSRLAEEFQRLCLAARAGNYEDPFFGDIEDSTNYPKRLRAVVTNRSLDFEKEIRRMGHYRKIFDTNDGVPKPGTEENESEGGPIVISRGDYLLEVEQMLKESRGRELPGMFNPMLVSPLFQKQARPWNDIANDNLVGVWDAAMVFLEILLHYLAEETVAANILRLVIQHQMDGKLQAMKKKLEELVSSYQKLQPITYNHYLIETVQKFREERQERLLIERMKAFFGTKGDRLIGAPIRVDLDIAKLAKALSVSTEKDMDKFAASEIVDYMQAYYKVALKTFIDNSAVQDVEEQLVKDLESLLSPTAVYEMDVEIVRKIAAEPAKTQNLRDQTQRKLKGLQKALDTCKPHAERNRLDLTGASYQSRRRQIQEPSGPTTPSIHSSEADALGTEAEVADDMKKSTNKPASTIASPFAVEEAFGTPVDSDKFHWFNEGTIEVPTAEIDLDTRNKKSLLKKKNIGSVLKAAQAFDPPQT